MASLLQRRLLEEISNVSHAQGKKQKQEEDQDQDNNVNCQIAITTNLFHPLSKAPSLYHCLLPLIYSLLNFKPPPKTHTHTQNPMEKHQSSWYVVILSIVISLGLISFASCVAAEFKKAKIEDMKWDRKECYVSGSDAFGHGIVALMCLFISQIIGNLVICRKCCCREKSSSCKAKKPSMVTALLVISWISFGIVVVIVSAATSMSRTQAYGKGWLEGECYLVRDGLYIGSSVLVLLAIATMLGSAILTKRQSQDDQGRICTIKSEQI